MSVSLFCPVYTIKISYKCLCCVSVPQVLVVGCGNSELSEQLYDVGYKHLINIDISETVVTHMNQRNAERRPGLSFHQVDATQTPYEDASYQAALDKGTLDAMASEEEGALARKMLTEVKKKKQKKKAAELTEDILRVCM